MADQEKKVILTREGYEKLEKELDYYISVRRNEISEQIAIARGFGDLSENAEYDEAKNEQGKLYSRIAEVENILTHAIIVEESDMPTNVVSIGSKVTITALDSGKSMHFKVVGSQEADFKSGAISEDSPVGKALMGAKAGQTVVVEAPRGAMRYTVDKIER